MRFKGFVLPFFLLFSLFAMPFSAHAGIISDVETITNDPAGKEVKTIRKYFSDGKNIRYEEETKEGKVIEILNYDTKKKYVVYDALKVYILQDLTKEEDMIKDALKMEDTVDENKKAKDAKKDQSGKKPLKTVEKKKTGEEDYEGYKCAIYEIKITMVGRVTHSTVWVAKELNDLIVKSENISYLGIKTSIAYKNIRKADTEQPLFLPPKDYKSMSPY
ncbi:MAG: DUF4412 domain-containing protein [Nitrospirota bacterium]